MTKTFEQYLSDRCFEENPTILDDDMPDFFSDWLSNQDVSSILIYADGWMRETKAFIAAEFRKITN